MDRPQQPELYRSGNTALEPDSVESDLAASRRPRSAGPTLSVPPDNRPGHHPQREQDQPDLDEVAQRLGTTPTKRELYREASRRRIRGRSRMSKAELLRAVQRGSV
ncbi:MAG TPA: hypothetical protein VF152_10995 [Acidimicrobiia bacterium]